MSDGSSDKLLGAFHVSRRVPPGEAVFEQGRSRDAFLPACCMAG
jgi:hypothetical protein